MKIYLRDRNQELIDAWKVFFRDVPEVEASCGDIFDIEADAIVSPANSFGFMNGGIDQVYTNRFGQQLQDRLQKELVDRYYGELLVGQALVIPIGIEDKYKYLISAPTMRIPQPIMHTVNAFLAFKAVLIEAQKSVTTYQDHGGGNLGSVTHFEPIKSILCPGLGTAIGKMPYMSCAYQMREAYRVVMDKSSLQFEDLADAYTHHASMRQGVPFQRYPTTIPFKESE